MKSQHKITYLIIVLVFCNLNLFSQKRSIDGKYVGDNEETIIIEDDHFTILSDILTLKVDPKNDTIAYGKVRYHGKDFIELNSISDSYNVGKNIVFTELHDSTINKISTRIKFQFPLSDQYKIKIDVSNDVANLPYFHKSYEFINQSEIIIPIKVRDDYRIWFKIYDLDLNTEVSGMNYHLAAFTYYDYSIKDNKTNYIHISIPNLTKYYFQHYAIKGEYAQIKTGKLGIYALWWRGKYYAKSK